MELSIWTDGYDWYVARDHEHVAELLKNQVGESYEDQCGEKVEDSFSILEGDYTMAYEDGDEADAVAKELGVAVELIASNQPHKVTAPVEKWISYNGEGFLGSTEY